jgi:hypothetical protein
MKGMLRWMAPALALGLLVPAIGMVVRAADAPAGDKGKVVGTVKGEDGKAVVGANVVLLPPREHHKTGDADKPKEEKPKDQAAGDKPGHGNKPEPIARGTTDGDGKFALNDVPPGTYELVARLKGTGMAREEVKVDAGQTVTCDLTLKKMEKKPQ